MVHFVEALHRRLADEDGLRFLNDPEATLRRLPRPALPRVRQLARGRRAPI